VHVDDEVRHWSLPGEDHARPVFLGCPTLALNFEILSYLDAEEPFIPLHLGVTLKQRLTKSSLALDQFLYQVIIHRLGVDELSVGCSRQGQSAYPFKPKLAARPFTKPSRYP
jgi:hypothetical protein